MCAQAVATKGGRDVKNHDRFLIAIVVGMVLLVVAVIVVVLVRGQPTYKPDGTPEATAFNYLLALRQKDYARAYSYLSTTLVHYPAEVDEFVRDVQGTSWSFSWLNGDISIATETSVFLENRATVEVRYTTSYSSDPFAARQYTATFDMALRAEQDGWKIVQSERCWDQCWSTPTQPCK